MSHIRSAFLLAGLLPILGGCFWNNTKEAPIISTYEDCVQAGNPVMGTYPEQCRTPDGNIFVKNIPIETLIRVQSPQAGDDVSNTITVAGDARGTWYFEASFPVSVEDTNGKVLVQSYATAQDDWMTEDFVPFTSTLSITPPYEGNAFIVLHNDNPSGLPERDRELRIPVHISALGAPQELTKQQKSLVEQMIRDNIGTLSPVKPVLGGIFGVNTIEWDGPQTATVTYEDGHIQLTARAYVSIAEDGTPVIDQLEVDESDQQQPPTSERKLGEEGEFCGGIAAFPCAEGLECQLDGDYPDAGGTCVKP